MNGKILYLLLWVIRLIAPRGWNYFIYGDFFVLTRWRSWTVLIRKKVKKRKGSSKQLEMERITESYLINDTYLCKDGDNGVFFIR